MAEEAPLLDRERGSEPPRLSKDAQLRAAARAAREANAAEPEPPTLLPRPQLQRRGASLKLDVELPPKIENEVEKPPEVENPIQRELARQRDALKAAAEEAESGPVREAREARAKARDERRQKRAAEREARKQERADKRNNKKPPGEGAKRAAAAFGNTLKKLPLRFSVVTNTVKQTISLAQGLGFLILLLLVVFIIHQLFLWVDQDPEIAFDRAALLFEVAEVTYDTSGILVNAAVDVANAAIIPIWNTASYYVVEPLVILVLELFVLVFTQKHYTGVYSEADFPYMGLDCTASATAAEWCGRYAEYAHKLESAEKAPYYVNESANYNPARRLHGGEERDVYVFGVSTARRLQGIVDEEPQFVAPAFEMDEIVDALQTVGEMVITLAPAIFDAFFGIANAAGGSSFGVIVEGFISLVKGVLAAMRWLIKSGLFTTIVNIGVEFLVIMLTELMIPLIFAAVDLLVCVLDLFKPSGWQVQFDCGKLMLSNSNIQPFSSPAL